MNVDVHCHLLPGVDDGSQKMTESLKVLEQMKAKGAQRVYLTPHLYSPDSPTHIAQIKEAWREHSRALNSREIQVLLGSEVFLRPEVLTSEVIPLGESNLLLIELATRSKPPYLFEAVEALQVRGFKIVLAHVERYRFFFKKKFPLISSPELDPDVLRLKNMGVLFQVNWDSVKRTSPETRILLKSRLVDLLGSDKHHSKDGRGVIDFGAHESDSFYNDYYL